MDYREAIETLQDIHDVAESRIKNGDARGVIYIPQDKLDDLKTAISAMQELSGYEDKLTEIYGEHAGMIETIVDGLVEYWKTFGIKNPIKARLLTNGDVDLWEGYKRIGTLDEVREAVEKQKAKKPKNVSTEGYRYTDTYRCPTCGGNFSGTGIANNCYHCGQRLDWGEVE